LFYFQVADYIYNRNAVRLHRERSHSTLPTMPCITSPLSPLSSALMTLGSTGISDNNTEVLSPAAAAAAAPSSAPQINFAAFQNTSVAAAAAVSMAQLAGGSTIRAGEGGGSPAPTLADNLLYGEIADYIHLHQSVPTLRTQYLRAAFQHRNDNQVRISLDTSLIMLRERIIPGAEWLTPEERLEGSDVHRFPYAVSIWGCIARVIGRRFCLCFFFFFTFNPCLLGARNQTASRLCGAV